MLSDLRAAIRFVLRRPGFCAIAAFTLAMGIAANVSVFALVRSLLFTAEPYRAPRELFQLLPSDHMASWPFEPFDIEEVKRIPGVTRVAGCTSASRANRAYPSLLVSVTEVSQDFFSLFGARAQLGRTLQPADFVPGVRNAVISFDLWETLLGRTPEVVGHRIQINSQPFNVVGVMPPTFAPPCFEHDSVRRQAWIPLRLTGGSIGLRSSLSVFARTSPTMPLAVVQAHLDEYGVRRAAETGKASYAGMFFQRLGFEREREARPGLLLLQSLAACLLLIAGANLGSVLLLDASRRDAEFLTRASLGASPWRIARQLLIEATVIATLGGTMGAGFSLVIGAAMRSLVAPLVPRGVTYHVGLGDTIVGLTIGVATSLIFATFAAIFAARRARHWSGRTKTRGTAGRSVRRFQHALVAIQVALSVVLAIATGVIGLSYVKVASTDTGLVAEGVVTSIMYLPADASSSGRARVAQEAVTSELRRLDGALSIAFSDTPPFAGGSNWRVALDDAGAEAPPCANNR